MNAVYDASAEHVADMLREQEQEATSTERLTASDAYSNPPARIGFGSANLSEGAQYPLTRLTYDYMLLLSLYRSSGILRRIVNKPVEDAVAHWYRVDSQITPNQIDMLERCQRRTKVKKQLETGLKWGRLFGGAAGLILIEGQGDDLDKPLDLATIGPDSFKGIYVVDRWSGVYPSLETVNDIGNPAFGEPEFYEIRSNEDATADIRVHHSRILRFTGDELPYWEKQVEQYWGSSIIEVVFDNLKRYDSALSNIDALLYKAQVWVQKTPGMKSLLGIGTQKMQQNFFDTVQAQNELMSSFNTRVIDKEDDLTDHQYAFSGLDKVFETFMYALSSDTGIPITILFGRSAAGLDATGDADLDNYYTMLEGIQENKVKPLLEQLLPIMCMSEFGSVPDDINVAFNPVRIPTEKEKSDIANTKTTAILSALTAGATNQKITLKELHSIADSTGMWSNITDEDIDKADEAPEIGDVPPEGSPLGGQPQGEIPTTEENPEAGNDKGGAIEKLSTIIEKIKSLLLHRRGNDAEFEPDKHPRRDDGKFGEGSGNSSKDIDKEFRKQYSNVLLQSKTSDGVTIRKLSKHSLDRANGRKITSAMVKRVIQTAQPGKGNTERTHVYDKDGIRVVVDIRTGEIVTIMWRRRSR